jgi:hypothetical protein
MSAKLGDIDLNAFAKDIGEEIGHSIGELERSLLPRIEAIERALSMAADEAAKAVEHGT